ncbi:hypothetical protein MYX07_02905 [Patescibacteria group bacterium AH-259-L07]|nr:hypothetical protein [Patescibacteria group bacterium AH-259-L07]
MKKEYTPRPTENNVTALQQFQYEHDQMFHDDIFQMENNHQIRHIAFHAAKIAGRLADYFDKLDHQEHDNANVILKEIKNRRAPDLFIFALMLANRLNLNLEEEYFHRIKDVEKMRMK